MCEVSIKFIQITLTLLIKQLLTDFTINLIANNVTNIITNATKPQTLSQSSRHRRPGPRNWLDLDLPVHPPQQDRPGAEHNVRRHHPQAAEERAPRHAFGGQEHRGVSSAERHCGGHRAL